MNANSKLISDSLSFEPFVYFKIINLLIKPTKH